MLYKYYSINQDVSRMVKFSQEKWMEIWHAHVHCKMNTKLDQKSELEWNPQQRRWSWEEDVRLWAASKTCDTCDNKWMLNPQGFNPLGHAMLTMFLLEYNLWLKSQCDPSAQEVEEDNFGLLLLQRKGWKDSTNRGLSNFESGEDRKWHMNGRSRLQLDNWHGRSWAVIWRQLGSWVLTWWL